MVVCFRLQLVTERSLRPARRSGQSSFTDPPLFLLSLFTVEAIRSQRWGGDAQGSWRKLRAKLNSICAIL